MAFKWKEFEYQYVVKSVNWFWLIASGSLAIIIISILMRNLLFGIFGAIAGLVLAIASAKRPRKINFLIDKNGITINARLYPYKDLKSFWINAGSGKKEELIIMPQKTLRQNIKIPLGSANPESVREYLLKFLKEEKYEESLIETVANKAGF